MTQLKEDIRKLIENKGLTISEQELEIVTNRWLYSQSLRANLHKARLHEADIALKYNPGGEIDD